MSTPVPDRRRTRQVDETYLLTSTLGVLAVFGGMALLISESAAWTTWLGLTLAGCGALLGPVGVIESMRWLAQGKHYQRPDMGVWWPASWVVLILVLWWRETLGATTLFGIGVIAAAVCSGAEINRLADQSRVR